MRFDVSGANRPISMLEICSADLTSTTPDSLNFLYQGCIALYTLVQSKFCGVLIVNMRRNVTLAIKRNIIICLTFYQGFVKLNH